MLQSDRQMLLKRCLGGRYLVAEAQRRMQIRPNRHLDFSAVCSHRRQGRLGRQNLWRTERRCCCGRRRSSASKRVRSASSFWAPISARNSMLPRAGPTTRRFLSFFHMVFLLLLDKQQLLVELWHVEGFLEGWVAAGTSPKHHLAHGPKSMTLGKP